MSDACFIGTPRRVGPPFKAPLAWGASSRAMMDPGNDMHCCGTCNVDSSYDVSGQCDMSSFLQQAGVWDSVREGVGGEEAQSKRCALVLWAGGWAGRRQDRPWKVGSAASKQCSSKRQKKKRVPMFGPSLQTLRPQVLIPDLELATAGQRPDGGQCVLPPGSYPTSGCTWLGIRL